MCLACDIIFEKRFESLILMPKLPKTIMSVRILLLVILPLCRPKYDIRNKINIGNSIIDYSDSFLTIMITT
jgi:hypothetical protein